jgi:hypothetical protein
MLVPPKHPFKPATVQIGIAYEDVGPNALSTNPLSLLAKFCQKVKFKIPK